MSCCSLSLESERSFDVRLTEQTIEVLNALKKEQKTNRVYVLLDDTGCCGFSNVFVTCSADRLSDVGWTRLWHKDGIFVYGNRKFIESIKERELVLEVTRDVIIDDSLSLEAAHGKRAFLRYG